MAIFEKKQPQKPQEIVEQKPPIVEQKQPVDDDPARSNLYVPSKRSESLQRLIAEAQASQAAMKPVAPSAPATPAQKPEAQKQKNTVEKVSDAKTLEENKEAIRQARSKRRKTKQIMVRLSESDQEKLLQRVAKTGLSMSEFVRQAALTSRIVLPSNIELLASIDDQLAALCAEIGRQGGMLKMIIKPNKEMHELHPEEWDELTSAIRKLKYAQRDINTMREELKNGISTTQSEQ